MKKTCLFIISLALFGCGESADKRFDSGYSDGYAVGYNTACKIRATMVKGDWDDEEYSNGYAKGKSAGTTACYNK